MLIGLIKFLFWFFLISYLLKLLVRIFAPLLIKRFANKMEERFNQQFQNPQNPQNSSKEEGKVTLENINTSKKRKLDDLGDYVDFEEVEE